MNKTHDEILRKIRVELDLFYSSRTFARACLEISADNRRLARTMPHGARQRRAALMIALKMLDEAEAAFDICDECARRLGPLFDKLAGSEAAFERAIEVELEESRSWA